MKVGIARRMLAASALVALVVAAAFAVLIAAIEDLRDAAEASRLSERVEASANELERLTIDIQAAARGFVITGNEDYLDPWRVARGRIPVVAAELDSLIAGPAQRQRAAEIERGLTRYVTTWSEPLVELARRDREAAAGSITAGEGNRLVAELRGRFREFQRHEQEIIEMRAGEVDSSARRAILLGFLGVGLSALMVVFFAAYLSGTVARPVRALAGTARRLESGDLTARVATEGPSEIRDLGDAFNAMASALEQSRDELESQNVELETQQAELETANHELEAANAELEAQQDELARALAELREEKTRSDASAAFTTLLASHRHEEGPSSLEPNALRALCEFAGADVGILYTASSDETWEYVLGAAYGLDATRLPARLIPGEGLAGRAISERRTMVASHGETGLRVPVLGAEVAVHQEAHVPLEHGDATVGVLTLARLEERPFDEETVEALASLAAQTAITVSNRNAYTRAQRLANINRAVLDATRDAIRLIDADGRTLLANTAMLRLAREVLRLSDDGDLWRNLDDLADRTTDPVAYRAALETLKENPEAESFDEYQLADSGRWLQRYTTPVRDADGEVIGRMFVVRDVTAEREAEQLKTQLVATVSHELRTPLASIFGFSELLSRRELPLETHIRYAKTIHQEAQRLTTLINDFLDLQRIEDGAFVLQLEPFDLSDVLRAQTELFSLQSASHEIRLTTDGDEFRVVGERDRIAQVVSNLLSNAIKYSPRGGAVEVRAAPRDAFVRVSVRDDGLGIPASQQPSIFQKFFRVDSSDTREIGGTGLGLALCREIVTAHNGRIGFDSEHGHGSTFWFELPLPARRGAAPETPGGILVIEDDPHAAELLMEHLRSDGHEVQVVASGEEGLMRAHASPPLLICLDITLSGRMDGWQVLERLKADPLTSRVPVIVCTGGGGRHEAASLGANDFLAKPFSGEELRATVSRLVQTQHPTVLVVEDDDAVRHLVRGTLEGDGTRVVEAADGEEALAVVERERPDVIILDLMLPKLDGFAVLERLQERPETRFIPVVVVTAKQLSRTERERLRLRVDALMEKSSWSAEELRRVVRRTLGRNDDGRRGGGAGRARR